MEKALTGTLVIVSYHTNTITMISYQRLSHPDRYVIHLLLQEGKSIPDIARHLKRAPSSIYREIARNQIDGEYDYVSATQFTEERHSRANTKISGSLLERIIQGLQDDESPEQIAQRLRRDPSVPSISHTAIYNFIWKQWEEGGQLWRCLRFCGAKQRLRRYRGGARRTQLKKQATKRRIHERPATINDRSRFGDWEMDLVEGAGRQRFLLVLVERRTRLIRACLLEEKHPREVLKRLRSLLKGYLVRSITTDNGFEFGDGLLFENHLRCKVYFTDAYASWQKGQIEHANGLLRQYFPKKRSLESAKPMDVRIAVSKINRRLRKSLQWRAPEDFSIDLQTWRSQTVPRAFSNPSSG